MADPLDADKLRQQSEEDLVKQLNVQRDQLYHLRYKMHVEEVENPNAKGVLRRNIARILTILREREIEAAKESEAAAAAQGS